MEIQSNGINPPHPPPCDLGSPSGTNCKSIQRTTWNLKIEDIQSFQALYHYCHRNDYFLQGSLYHYCQPQQCTTFRGNPSKWLYVCMHQVQVNEHVLRKLLKTRARKLQIAPFPSRGRQVAVFPARSVASAKAWFESCAKRPPGEGGCWW